MTFRRIETGKYGVFETTVVAVLNVNYCLFLYNGRWSWNVAGSGKGAELSDDNYKTCDDVKTNPLPRALKLWTAKFSSLMS